MLAYIREKRLAARQEKGYTLIELMITVAILGTLMAFAVQNFLSYRKKGADQAAITAASNFYNLAMVDFTDTSNTAAYNTSNPPRGFVADANVSYGGAGISFTNAGVGSGSMTFKHSNSSTVYTLAGSDGTIQ